MILFADNDILLKLASCNLLTNFLHALELSDRDITLTQEAKYSLHKQATNKLATDNRALTQIDTMLSNVSFLEGGITDQNDLLDIMALIDGIDGGESLLFLSSMNDADSRIATGDKLALKTLLRNSDQLGAIIAGIRGKVYTLELALLLLVNRLGIDVVSQNVCASVLPDKTLGFAFGPGRGQEHVLSCLSSETRPFTCLLAMPDLVLPLEH
jgi:hypothetical protein